MRRRLEQIGRGGGAVASLTDGPVVPERAALVLEAVVEDARWGDDMVIEAMLLEIGSAIRSFETEIFPRGGTATIAFQSDAQVRALNRQYRKIDKATNVLSFPATGGVGGGDTDLYLGDIAIAFETVQREAAEQGIDARDHLIHLVVHGVLHLGGYDHMNEADAAIMEGMEVGILARLGVPDPYAD